MSTLVSANQRAQLIELARQYLKSPGVLNLGSVEDHSVFDEKRIAALPQINSLLESFERKQISLLEFKETSERLSRHLPFWGFKNFSGQMQLNQYVNNVEHVQKEEILRQSIRAPRDDSEAITKIDGLHDFLKEQKRNSSYPKSIPRVSQGYFLSYFWEIQDFGSWPIYYGSSRKVLLDLGLHLDNASSPGEEYVEFRRIMLEISALFKAEGITSKYPFWFIEHVLWTRFMNTKEVVLQEPSTPKPKQKEKEPPPIVLGESLEWTPSIVSDLPILASNKETAWSKHQNLRPEKAFERKLTFAFTLLGYETEELGQGTGRQPDGIALSLGVNDGDYAIVYDAKARESRFVVGTSDREIYEYIQNKKDLLRKRNRIHKLYYLIISSEFDEYSANDTLRSLYKRTQVPVTLLRAEDLLFIIDTKLQNVEIDHARLEDLFLDTGIISREKISDMLGVR